MRRIRIRPSNEKVFLNKNRPIRTATKRTETRADLQSNALTSLAHFVV